MSRIEQRIGEHISRKSTEFKSLLTIFIWEKLAKILKLQISEESRSNLTYLNELLKTNPAVVYINHTSLLDAPLAISLVHSQLSNAKQLLGPVGMKHYDPIRDPFSAVFLRLVKKVLGINLLPVVQVSDTTNYGQKRLEMIDNLKKQSKIALNEPGSVYGMAPEGTRNKAGTLQRANKGIGYLAEYDHLYYLPIAIIYRKYSDKPVIVFGEPLLLEDILPPNVKLPINPKEKAQVIADYHMQRLANLMPEAQRGYYRQTDNLLQDNCTSVSPDGFPSMNSG